MHLPGLTLSSEIDNLAITITVENEVAGVSTGTGIPLVVRKSPRLKPVVQPKLPDTSPGSTAGSSLQSEDECSLGDEDVEEYAPQNYPEENSSEFSTPTTGTPVLGGNPPVTPRNKDQLVRNDSLEMIRPRGTVFSPVPRDQVLPLSSRLNPGAD